MGHRCCPAGGGNRNDGPSMLRERHPWAINAVARPGAAASMAHGWVSAGVSFWSAPPHDPEGAVSPADPARISRHSGHSAQPAVPPREAGALYPRKNHGKVPPPLQQDPRDPPHSHGNAPMAHRCRCGRGRPMRVRRVSYGVRPSAWCTSRSSRSSSSVSASRRRHRDGTASGMIMAAPSRASTPSKSR